MIAGNDLPGSAGIEPMLEGLSDRYRPPCLRGSAMPLNAH